MRSKFITAIFIVVTCSVGIITTQNNQADAAIKSSVKKEEHVVAEAKARVDKLSKIKKIDDKKNNVPDYLQNQLKDAKNNVNNAQNKVNYTKNVYPFLINQKQEAQQQIDYANNKNSRDNNPKYADAQDEYNKAKANYDDAVNNYNSLNTGNAAFTPLTPGSKEDIKYVVNNYNDTEGINKLDTWIRKQSTFKWTDNNVKDANDFIDFNNITDDQQSTIQSFMGSVINSYRQQLGIPLIYTNAKDLTNIANKRVHTDVSLKSELRYDIDDYMSTIKVPGNYLSAGLAVNYQDEVPGQGIDKTDGSNVTGKVYNGFDSMNHVSMKEIKEAIYNDIQTQIIRDFSHLGMYTSSIFRIGHTTYNDKVPDLAIVVFDKYGHSHYEFIHETNDYFKASDIFRGATQSTFSNVSQQMLDFMNRFSSLNNAVQSTKEKMDYLYQDNTSDLIIAQEKMKFINNKINDNQDSLSKYTSELSHAEDSLKDIQSKVNVYKSNNEKLKKDDQEALAKAKKEYSAAVKALNNAKSGKGKSNIIGKRNTKNSKNNGKKKTKKTKEVVKKPAKKHVAKKVTKKPAKKHVAKKIAKKPAKKHVAKKPAKKRVVKKSTKKYVVKKMVKKAKHIFRIRVKAKKIFAYKTIALHKSGRKLEKKGTKLYVYNIVKKGHKKYYRIYGNRVITSNKNYVVKVK